ncbi:MAG: DNA-formamidopyrimidine glycosylase family protein [Flavobacteriales bacterium]
MPEGPEVKIASKFYNSFFKEAKNMSFDIINEYYEVKYKTVFEKIKNHHPKDFVPSFTVGKNLFIPLNNNYLFNFHLGMTGCWSHEKSKHCHFKISSSNGELFFKDVRKFGKMRILTFDEFAIKHSPQFDLLHEDYNTELHLTYLTEKITPKRSICSVLMDQNCFPGVGNYIKSEALFAAKIHPEKKWGQLSKRKKITLIEFTKEIMHHSFQTGGAELKDFKNPFDQSQFSLKVYGKKNDPEGNEVISQLTSDQRKSWFCPSVQK